MEDISAFSRHEAALDYACELAATVASDCGTDFEEYWNVTSDRVCGAFEASMGYGQRELAERSIAVIDLRLR
jgi:hypothetical protein